MSAIKIDSSGFTDLQKPQVKLDGKSCAAVGQNGLMALYDTLFNQLDETSSQLLVTDNDFKNADFRVHLGQTVNYLIIRQRSIPIFNENDTIGTRKAPYEDATGILWDNDNLAALLAIELNADLLLLLLAMVHSFIKTRVHGFHLLQLVHANWLLQHWIVPGGFRLMA